MDNLDWGEAKAVELSCLAIEKFMASIALQGANRPRYMVKECMGKESLLGYSFVKEENVFAKLTSFC